ncbi:hypothetical protein [Nitrosopumilus adriaticus]|uniref:Uncharacterized protein n=1 Tax=Nitrosopumilus adriaticus TaxID=1580092 RepID=A0A0D5BZV0_9ARCH|nr:hypothetical protein [Nitrosopumilus adriaticus]AJW69707.1 conserved exported protein of unknown function [Nitrosopumilus adriaticus]
MKKYQSFGFIASVVFAVGMMGFNLSDGTFGSNQMDSSAMNSGTMITGHLEAIHTDSDGNILSYIQTDNAITNQGINCAMVELFGIPQATLDLSGTDTSCAASPGDFNYIGLYSADADAVGLNVNATSSIYTDSGLTPLQDTSVTFNTVASGAARATDVQVVIDATFTATDDTNSVFGASLLNGTANNGIFAFKDFNSADTAIVLNTNDQLTVNWQISMTGTTAIDQT